MRSHSCNSTQAYHQLRWHQAGRLGGPRPARRTPTTTVQVTGSVLYICHDVATPRVGDRHRWGGSSRSLDAATIAQQVQAVAQMNVIAFDTALALG